MGILGCSAPASAERLLLVAVIAGSFAVSLAPAQTIEAVIPLPGGIGNVDVNPNTNSVYVGGSPNDVVQGMVWIDGNTNQLAMSPGPGQGEHVNPVTNKIYAADLYGGHILVYSGADGSLLKTISTFGCPMEAVIDSSFNHVWGGGQCGSGNDPAFPIDGSTDTLISGCVGSGGVMGEATAVNPVTHAFYMLVGGSVEIEKEVNPSTLTLTDAPFSAALVAVNPQTGRMYGADLSGKNVLAIDATTESPVATLPVSQTGAIAVNPTRNRVYAVDLSLSPQAIKVFDGGTNTLIGSMPLRSGDQACCGMAVNSSTGKTYLPVSDLSSQSLLVIDDTLGGSGPKLSSVVNAASYTAPVAPGALVAIFGSGLATATASAAGLPLPTSLNGTQVLMNGIPMPLFFVSAGQINAQVPWNISGSSVSTQASVNSALSNTITAAIAPAAPAVFTTSQSGSGQGAVLISSIGELAAASGSVAGVLSRPVLPGEYISIYCTGLGAVTNPPLSGEGASSSQLSNTLPTPTVMIGDTPANVGFSGLAPGFVGLYQVNAGVPANVPAGDAMPI